MAADLDFDRQILIVGIEGLFNNTGQLAHVGLGRKNGMPVVYVDSKHFYNEDLLRHEKDEIARWEAERMHRNLDYDGMRSFIIQYRDMPEPSTGLTTRRLADDIHASSHNIDHIYAAIKDERLPLLSIGNIYSLYLAYGLDENDIDINIAAHDGSSRKTSARRRLQDNLEKLSNDPSTGITESAIREILERVASGEIRLAGEDLDIIKVDAAGNQIVIGPVDARIAHLYRLLHRTANTFVITPDGKFIIQRRVHNKSKPLALTIPGGHVSSGKNYRQTVATEFTEEAGLPEGWEPKGSFHLIGRLGGFSNTADSNNESVSNYFYFATPEETKIMRRDIGELNAMKHRMTRQAFERWIEREQKSHSPRGETWSLYEFSLEDLIGIASGQKTVSIGEDFADGRFESQAELTDDTLQRLLRDEDVIDALKRALRALTIDHRDIENNLKNARAYFAERKYTEAGKAIDAALEDIGLVLSVGCSRDDPILAYYYNAKVMKKVLKGYNEPSDSPLEKSSAQVLLLDSRRQSIVMQVRGPFKRLFAGKRTVSANAKVKSSSEESSAIAEAVKNETGLSIDPARLRKPGTPIVRKGRLTSLDFIAFSADEEKALHNAYELIKTGRFDHGITIEWDPRKRSLCVFSMDPACDHGKLRVVADRIQEFTGIVPIYAVFNEDNTS
ncbi:MAG: NUDIX domain-containing protein, partial [Candidatus Omnitrophica bacterium]|nr:NUDIX domain-containing protein [Candidatus Omnitrophota bacterium]